MHWTGFLMAVKSPLAGVRGGASVLALGRIRDLLVGILDGGTFLQWAAG